MTNGNKGTPNAEIRFWLISFPSIQNMMTVAHSITSWLYTLYLKTNLQMAQLSTTMSQAHRATAFHFLTSNLNRMIEQWRKFFYAQVTIILQYLFLSFPATTPEPLGCSESLSTSILQLGFIQSLKVEVYHFMIFTSVSQLKSFSANQAQRLCPSSLIALYHSITALVSNCVD